MGHAVLVSGGSIVIHRGQTTAPSMLTREGEGKKTQGCREAQEEKSRRRPDRQRESHASSKREREGANLIRGRLEHRAVTGEPEKDLLLKTQTHSASCWSCYRQSRVRKPRPWKTLEPLLLYHRKW